MQKRCSLERLAKQLLPVTGRLRKGRKSNRLNSETKAMALNCYLLMAKIDQKVAPAKGIWKSFICLCGVCVWFETQRNASSAARRVFWEWPVSELNILPKTNWRSRRGGQAGANLRYSADWADGLLESFGMCCCALFIAMFGDFVEVYDSHQHLAVDPKTRFFLFLLGGRGGCHLVSAASGKSGWPGPSPPKRPWRLGLCSCADLSCVSHVSCRGPENWGRKPTKPKTLQKDPKSIKKDMPLWGKWAALFGGPFPSTS